VAAYVVAPFGGFRRVAVWSAGLLVLSGAVLALMHFVNLLQTMTSAYGQVLMVKLAAGCHRSVARVANAPARGAGRADSCSGRSGGFGLPTPPR